MGYDSLKQQVRFPMIKLLPFLFILSCMTSAFAQDTGDKRKTSNKAGIRQKSALAACSLTLEQVSAIRGLRLRTSEDQINKALPFRRGNEKTIFPNLLDTYPGFENVDVITVGFYQDKMSELTVRYTPSVKFDSILVFAENVAENLKLPFAAWRFKGDDTASMSCKGFAVEIRTRSGASISLVDKDAELAKQSELEKERVEKQRTFKP